MTRCRFLLVISAWSSVVLTQSSVAIAQGAAGQPAPSTFTLEQALQYAVDHYPTVRAALEQVTAATSGVSVARAAYLPRFDSLWQTNRATANNIFGQLLPTSVIPSMSGPVLPSATATSAWGTAVGGLLSWEPVDFGLRDAMVHEAEAGVVRARAEQDLTRLSVQRAVGVAFLRLVSAAQATKAAQADVQRREVLARVAHTLADNQLRPGADATRADAELAVAQTRAIQAREAVAVAQSTLGLMLGVAEDRVEANPARLLDETEPGGTNAAPVLQHPLVQTGQAGIDLARAHETVLSKTNRPRLYVQSSLFARASGANPDGSFDGGADGLWPERANWGAGVQVIFPNLFDFGSLRARRAVAGALTRIEGARYDEAVLAVTTSQRTADAVVDAARAIARNTPVQLAAARLSETQARARYEVGLAGIVEVAEAQNLLAGAETLSAVARVDVWRALLEQAIAQGSLTPFIELLRAPGAP